MLSALLALLIYLTILVAIGIFSAKKSRSSSSFILGNRGLNYWVAAISANASDMSVWLFMGLPMVVYQEGLFQIWTAIGLIVCMFLNWHLVAKKLRKATEKYDSLTLFTFFERRLGQKALSIRVLGALLATLFLTIYISSGITGMGYLFESIFGLDYTLGCLTSVIVIMAYLSLGGFTAICYADFAQGIFLLFVILLVPALVFFGPISSAHNIEAFDTAFLQPIIPRDLNQLFSALTLALGWGLGYFGQPHILNKFMAIKNPDDLDKSKWLGTAWQILALGGAVISGLAALYFFSGPQNNPELIFVDMVKSIFNPFFASLVLCAILAATLSTVDSQILVVASVVAEDFYAALSLNKPTDKKILLISRLAALVTCGIALIIALFRLSSIFALVNYCWVGIGSSFGPLVLASLYFKKLTKNAALAGMLVGGLVGIFWIFLGSSISATLPGFLSGLLTIWFVSNMKESNLSRTFDKNINN
jgi:sodium/proline symporter